jgi:hypothetical protein
MIWLAFFSGSLFGATIVGWAARKQIRETQAEALRLISARHSLELTTEDAARRVVV